MSSNDRFSEERKQLYPQIDLLDTNWYDFGDCPDYGCSNCNIAMKINNICLMEKRFERYFIL